MKKKIGFELIDGFKTGIVIGLFCSIFFSSLFSRDVYIPVPPHFAEKINNQLMAFIISVLSWGMIGLIFTATSFIFRLTDWSITKMTVIHAVVSYALFMPFAFFLEWIRFNVVGVLMVTLIYIFIYMIVWSLFMWVAKKEIQDVNRHLK